MPEGHCLETTAWKECGGESKWGGVGRGRKGRGVNMAFHNVLKKKMALVSYRPFIDFAFPPSIAFLLVAASYCLLKKEKCQNLQIFKGPGTGCWTSPFPSQEKSLFWFSFNFDSFFAFLMYIACASPLPNILWDVCIRQQEEGRKKRITSKQLSELL